MAFNFKTGSKSALLQVQSSKILSTFTKVKDDLNVLNETIHQSVAANAIQIVALVTENKELVAMKEQHDKIVKNINAFLS